MDLREELERARSEQRRLEEEIQKIDAQIQQLQQIRGLKAQEYLKITGLVEGLERMVRAEEEAQKRPQDQRKGSEKGQDTD